MPTGSYRYDRAEGGWRPLDDPTAPVMSTEQVTDDRFFQRGTNLYYAPDSHYVGRIADVSGSVINVSRDGAVFLTNELERYRLAAEPGQNDFYSALLTGSVELPTGERIELAGDFTGLAPTGEALYVPTTREPGKNDYLTAGDPRIRGEGWRPATPQELINRGRTGLLLSAYGDQIRRLAAEGVTLDDGTVTTDVYRVAQWVAQQVSFSAAYTRDLTAEAGF